MATKIPPGFDEEVPPLLERLPDYLATFGIGLVVSGLIGALIWLTSDIPVAMTIGYTVILYGVVLLLAGGASGGGYTNMGMGAMGSFFGGRSSEDAYVDGSTRPRHDRPRHDPLERLRKGLRPEANPRAFWQVIAGALYIAIGLAIVILGSPPTLR